MVGPRPHPRPFRIAAFTAVTTAAASALLLPAPAAGQGAGQTPPAATDPRGGDAPADTFHLPQVVVTATGEATPRALLPQSITVLDGADLRSRGVTFLLEALQEVPGTQVVRTGSMGGSTSIFLRGGNSNFVKVMLDGVPLNEPGGRFDFGSFTLENIERIEVVRGPSSVLYGSDAVSGVIHLFTREGGDGDGSAALSAALQAGSLGTWSGEAGARGGSDRSSWSLALGRTDSDGFHPVNNRFSALVGSGRLALRPDDRSRVALSLRVQESRYHFPTDGSGEIADLNQFTFDDGVTLSLEGTRRMGETLDGRLLLRAGQAQRGFENEPDSPADTLGFGYRGHRLGNAVRRGADARLTWNGGPVRATGGVDWEVERERLQSRTESNFGEGPAVSADTFGEDRWNVAGYGQVEAEGPGRSRLSLGTRLDRNEVFGTFLTGQAGVVIPVAQLGRLRGSVGTAYKAPTFSQQFADTPFERGNPELEPETSSSLEAGWDGGFLGNRLVLGASVFRQDFRKLIQYENRGAQAPTYHNEDRARSTGMEASASWRWAAGFLAGVDYTRVNARVRTDDPEEWVDGEAPRLLRRPGRHVAGRARAPLPVGSDGASMGLTANHVGSRVDTDFSSFPAARVTLEGYTTLDLDVQVPLHSFLATLRVENMADTEYTSVVGFPGKGRMVFLGLRWNP
jgi:vitamin B12 transporter